MQEEKRPRVLCVDDDPVVLFHLRNLLGRGFEIWESPSGREGLELMEKGGVDWVILDYELGDMNGGEFLTEALRCGHRPNYLLISGHSAGELDWQGLRPLGIKGSLKKPLEKRQIVSILAGGGL